MTAVAHLGVVGRSAPWAAAIIFFASVFSSPAQEQSSEASVATLEGQVIEAKKKVDIAEQKVQAAEVKAEATMPSADKAEVQTAEAELDGLVVEQKKQEVVVRKTEHRCRQVELTYETTKTPEAKQEVEKARRDHDKAVGLCLETSRKIDARREEIGRIIRRSASVPTRLAYERSENELVHAQKELTQARENLAVAKDRSPASTGLAERPSRHPAPGISFNAPVEGNYFRDNEFEVRVYGIAALGQAQTTSTTETHTTSVTTQQVTFFDGVGDVTEEKTTRHTTTHKSTKTAGPFSNYTMGAGVNLEYYFARYFGVGIAGQWWDGEHPAGLVLGSFILRYPIEGKLHLTPYVYAGGGGQFADTSRGVGFVGGGIEKRFCPWCGIFTDARWLFDGHQENVAEILFGFNFAFGAPSILPFSASR